MSPDDLDEVCAMERVVFSDPWPRSAFESDIRTKSTFCPVLRDTANKLIGYANLMTFAEEAHLTNIAVSPDHRREGIGRIIMDHLLQKAESEGCRAMFLDVRVSNRSAISFYQKYDFTELYRRKRYYHNPPEDAVVMVRPIGERKSHG